MLPGAVGLYIVTASKNASENQIAANKELLEKEILANKELGLEIIKANEAKIENLLMKFLSDKNMIK